MNFGPKEYALGAALLGGAIGVAMVVSKPAAAKPVVPPVVPPTNGTQGGGASSPPTSAPPPVFAPAPMVTITQADDGSTIQLRLNQPMTIDLSASGNSWSISDSTGIMQPQTQNSAQNVETWIATKVGTDTITCVPATQSGTFSVNTTFNIVVT